MVKKKTYTAKDLIMLLRERYAAPEYAFIEEARAGTGWKANRSADGLALSLWPSRGIYFHGFEIKVHRGDWHRELKNPEKAEEIAAFCRCWWIVAPPKMISPDELPATWGLLEPYGKGLKTIVKAPLQEAEPIDINFVAAVLRRMTAQYVPQSRLKELVADGVAKGVKNKTEEKKWEKERHQKRDNMVQEFEKASGVKISEWNAGNIGLAVKYVCDKGIDRVAKDLDMMAERAEHVAVKAREEANIVRAELLGTL